MGHLREVELEPSFQPFAVFREQFGFVPQLFRAQTQIPGLIAAEQRLLSAVLFEQRALSRVQKECILLVLAAANECPPCVAIHYQMLRLLSVPEQRLDQILAGPGEANLSTVNAALGGFALQLATHPGSLSRDDVSGLAAQGLTEDALLEAVLTAALGNLLCTLATGLRAEADFPVRQFPSLIPVSSPAGARDTSGPFLSAPELREDEVPPFRLLRRQFC